MIPTEFVVLDESSQALDPAVTCSGFLSVDTQPQAWQAAEVLNKDEQPTHRLRICDDVSAVRPRRYVRDATGREYRVLRRVEESSLLYHGTALYLLRLEVW